MWLITGPFDSESGDVTTTKTKLLKTGQKIGLGRKDKHLVVNSKKISRDHCEFTVGPYTETDVTKPSFLPTLEIYNAKEKAMSIDRDGEPLVVPSLSSRELKSGDRINIVVGIPVVVEWRRIACFLPPARSLPSISTKDCATLGLSLISAPDSLATHHLTPKYELSIPLATSLLSATQFVKVEWLQELLRLGSTSDSGHPLKLAPLEQSFTPPLETKYRPIFSHSLDSSLKSFKFWEPNEERIHFLKGYRFVLLCEAERQADDNMRELVVRGDGEYECFPLTNSEAKWRQLLAKAKRKVDEVRLKVVILAREDVVEAAVGVNRWQEMIAEAESLSLPFINQNTLMNAVINTDTSLINKGSLSKSASSLPESESPLPDFVPNSHPDEPSPPVAEKTATSPIDRKSPSPPATMFMGLSIPPPPSKKLIRRSKTTRRSEEPVEFKDEKPAEDLGYSIPPMSTIARSTRLKRRAPSQAPSVEPVAEVEHSEEPPLKKFKALFDAIDPDKMSVEPESAPVQGADVAIGESIGSNEASGTLTQSGSRPSRSHKAASRVLDVVAEEEEESEQSLAAPPAPTQSEPHRQSPVPQATQGACENKRGSRKTSKPPSKQAEPRNEEGHQIDTDPAFLTALASRKGKKTTEDEFDREFNKLRISKPDIRRGEEDQPWEILGDFDSEVTNLRGNFMVVIQMELPHRNSGHGKNGAARVDDDRPNFKKFKKTPTPSSRAPIELVARGEHDYGVGSGYWKDKGAYNTQETLATQTARTQKRRAPAVLESDGVNTVDELATKKTKKVTRKAPQSKAREAAQKLFLDSDGEDSAPVTKSNFLECTDQSPTAEAEPVPKLVTKGSKKRHIIVDDDSDDGVAFKGFGKKRRTR